MFSATLDLHIQITGHTLPNLHTSNDLTRAWRTLLFCLLSVFLFYLEARAHETACFLIFFDGVYDTPDGLETSWSDMTNV